MARRGVALTMSVVVALVLEGCSWVVLPDTRQNWADRLEAAENNLKQERLDIEAAGYAARENQLEFIAPLRHSIWTTQPPKQLATRNRYSCGASRRMRLARLSRTWNKTWRYSGTRYLRRASEMDEEKGYTIWEKVFQAIWFLFVMALAVLFTLWIMPGGDW